MSEGKPADAKIQKKGDPKNPAEEVRRGFLQVLGGATLPIDASGSGRLELAAVVDQPSKPVDGSSESEPHLATSLWARDRTNTQRFRHPRQTADASGVVDFLATRFVQSGWSIKAMHRLVMLSHTYQIISAGEESGARKSSHAVRSNRNGASDDLLTNDIQELLRTCICWGLIMND